MQTIELMGTHVIPKFRSTAHDGRGSAGSGRL